MSARVLWGDGGPILRNGKLQFIPDGVTAAECVCCDTSCPPTECKYGETKIVQQVTWNLSIPEFLHWWFFDSGVSNYWVHTIVTGLDVIASATVTRNGDCSWPEFSNTTGSYERWWRSTLPPAHVCPVMEDWGIVDYESGTTNINIQHHVQDPIDDTSALGISATTGLTSGLQRIGVSFSLNMEPGWDPCGVRLLRGTAPSGQPTFESNCRAVEHEYFGTATPSF